jgi:integrase
LRSLSVCAPTISGLANTGLRIEKFFLRLEKRGFGKRFVNRVRVFARKTQKIREIPINAKTRRVLEYWALGRKGEFVFYNHETGNPFVDLDAGLELACKKARIDGITWHRLRHTFNTRLLEQGADLGSGDLVTVQQLLGHSTVTVTMRYAHPNLDSKRNATAKLESFGDSLVTPCTKMQQMKSKVSPIAPLSAASGYN